MKKKYNLGELEFRATKCSSVTIYPAPVSKFESAQELGQALEEWSDGDSEIVGWEISTAETGELIDRIIADDLEEWLDENVNLPNGNINKGE